MIEALMLLLGLGTHWLKQIITARRAVGMTPVSIEAYWIDNWPETCFALLSSVAAYVGLLELGFLTPLNAWTAGYMANSIADIFASRLQSMINPQTYSGYYGIESDSSGEPAAPSTEHLTEVDRDA